jgi:hypothetical protein
MSHHVALGVEVHQHNLITFLGETGDQCDGSCGFSHSSFLINNSNGGQN